VSERRTIQVGALARVEGEGALHLVFEGERVAEVRLDIYEPPRFFEAFLRGRPVTELPDLMARICGICPVAYQMSAVHALERIFEVPVHPQVRALRRLYYAGEWMESHLLHMMFLAAPDYLGLDDAFEIARFERGQVERALRLRQLGNRILILLGARSVNPSGVRIGGFHRLPTPEEISGLADELHRARGEAEALTEWFGSLSVPRRVQPCELVALRGDGEYPMNEGPIVSSQGIEVDAQDYDRVFEEHQVPHSTALHSRVRERGAYLVGPLARLWLNRDVLSPTAAQWVERFSERFEEPDPAAGVFARAVEVIQAIDDALAVCTAYAPPSEAEARPAWTPRAGEAAWATEAPRGVLWVQVRSNAEGEVEAIRIVPPTSQNQAQIEADLRRLGPDVLRLPEDEARRRCESAIRDYDPCISCSTHFLDLRITRRGQPDESGQRARRGSEERA
jgi:sulfhydrogenase subunit alpha